MDKPAFIGLVVMFYRRSSVGEYPVSYNLGLKSYWGEVYEVSGKCAVFSYLPKYYLPNYKCMLYADASYMAGNMVYTTD